MQPDRIYEIELWDMNGKRIADISSLAMNRSYVRRRNDAELLTFDLDIYKFDEYCQNIGEDPKAILGPWITDVKVKRRGTYLFGTVVVDVSTDLGDLASSDAVIKVSCQGYLNLFNDRYLTKTYSGTEATSIAADLITQTQAQTNGDMGITIAASQYETGVLRDRTYSYQNIKEAIQNLTTLVDGNFDFSFTYDRQFKTYERIGSRRGDVYFIYGDGGNVVGLKYDRSGLTLANKVYGLGSGLGDVAVTSPQGNNDSQLQYGVHESVQQFNSVENQTPLDEDVEAYLNSHKDILALPQVIITSNEVPDDNFLSEGDRIPLKVNGIDFLSDINGLYRIEQMSVDIDDTDFETITLTFDDFEVDQNESPS